MVQYFACPVCKATIKPGLPRPAAARKVYQFNYPDRDSGYHSVKEPVISPILRADRYLVHSGVNFAGGRAIEPIGSEEGTRTH